LKVWIIGARRMLVWVGPALVLLLAVVSGFLTWVLTTQQGSRWLLITAARQFDGEVRDVHGSVLQGLRVGHLSLSLPDAAVQARDVQLDVDWWALWERRLHVRTLSAQALALALNVATSPKAPPNRGAETPTPEEMGVFTAWPIPVALDRLALARLDVQINGEALSLGVDGLELAARVTGDGGSVRMRKLALAHALGDVALQADVAWRWDAWAEGFALKTVDLDVRLLDGAHWNNQPLTGALLMQAQPAPVSSSPSTLYDLATAWTLPQLALDVTLGQNRVTLDGAFGLAADRLALDVNIPTLAEFWPQLAGSLRVQGQAGGGVVRHQAELQAVFTPSDRQPSLTTSQSASFVLADEVKRGSSHPEPKTPLNRGGDVLDRRAAGVFSDQAPVQIALAFTGHWEHPGERNAEWRARITQLRVQRADAHVDALEPLTLDGRAQTQGWQWTIGAVPLRLALNGEALLTLDHEQSIVGDGRWETRGGIAQLHLTDVRIEQLRRVMRLNLGLDFGPDFGLTQPLRPVDASRSTVQAGSDVHVSTDWHLRFTDTLEGEWTLRHRVGDLVIPWDPPVPMGLRSFTLQVHAVRTAAGSSQLRGVAAIDTEAMGAITLHAQTQLRGDWQLASPGQTVVEVHSDMADLGWLNVFSTVPVELDGAVTTHLKAQHRSDGRWTTEGRVAGQGIRIVYPDEGVRLLDGTLAARFDDEYFVLEALRFPARLRVEPRERRTREWIRTDPDAQNGSLTVSGSWHLRDQAGGVAVALHRYSLLQRSDRHAMFSGTVRVDAAADASALVITGDLSTDAGWVDLDIVSGVPTLDGDVVVQRAGDAPASSTGAAFAAVSLDLTIDLGSRVYLTGYGLDSALEGQLRLRMQDGRLRADGALQTRGGVVSAYGQQLRLQRGSLTFQGDTTSPVLDVVAVRAGDLAVQAGVRVAGTARRPRIELISTPEVNDVEKLSWLLLGRGPDQAGGDAVLLLSVGSSFFTGGEPFYRQFGLDELSMRAGALGATGSLLPVESVVRSLDAGTSDVERQFIVASKNISQDFTLSVEQALADTGTVGRISYRLARGLNASLSLGRVNGLALVYRWFSRDGD